MMAYVSQRAEVKKNIFSFLCYVNGEKVQINKAPGSGGGLPSLSLSHRTVRSNHP